MLVTDKVVRKFKDTNGNKYEIRKKTNGHYYFVIKENGKNNGKIINGSKNKIFHELQEIHKHTNFIDLNTKGE